MLLLRPDKVEFVHHQRNELSIVRKALAGDSDAQTHLFTSYTKGLYQAAFAVLRNKEDAEDAVQDGLSKAYSSLRSFQGRSSFSTWLTRIVINSARMIHRKRRNPPPVSLDEILETQSDRWSQAVTTQPDPETMCSATQIRALINEQCEKLRPKLKAAFRLHAIDGFSFRESSYALGVSVGAVKSRINRARRTLARGLGKAHEIRANKLIEKGAPARNRENLSSYVPATILASNAAQCLSE